MYEDFTYLTHLAQCQVYNYYELDMPYEPYRNQSADRWLTVKHYEASAVALVPEDDKKIRQAEREALREKGSFKISPTVWTSFHS